MISLDNAQEALLKSVMEHQAATNMTAFFVRLIFEESRRVIEDRMRTEKRILGRPRLRETEEEKVARWAREEAEPKTIPHPDQSRHKGELMNRYDLEIWSTQVDAFGPAEHKYLPGYMPPEERTG